MLTHVVFFVLGLGALVLGAELLVRGASKIALSLGISPLVVGLTIVAMGTSSPEVAVSVGAALGGQTDIAVGNVVGSNIFNVLFILGISAVIMPLVVHSQIIRQEVPIMIGASLILAVMIVGGQLSRMESALLLVLLVAYLVFLVRQSRAETKEIRDEYASGVPRKGEWDSHWAVQVLLIVAGLGLLVLGSGWLVDAAVAFARMLGVSDLVIGLTIIAAGTSMPEVATSIMAAIRGERDIAVGNVIGSNTFNILGCLGISGLVSPAGLDIAPAVLNFDVWVMIAVAVACLPVFLLGRRIGRRRGLLFLGYYAAYVVYLVMGAQQHDALEAIFRGDAELRAADHDRDARRDGDPRPAVAQRRLALPMPGFVAASPASRRNRDIMTHPPRASRALLVLLIAVTMLSGCALTNRLFRDRAAEERAAALLQLQLAVMRFADEYAARVDERVVAFQQATNDPGERLAAQSWRVSQATGAFTIAAGPNPELNAIDMLVFATLSRMVIEDRWVAKLYGPRADGLLAAHRVLESRAWSHADVFLTAAQIDELRTSIAAWHRDNPLGRAVPFIHLEDFAFATSATPRRPQLLDQHLLVHRHRSAEPISIPQCASSPSRASLPSGRSTTASACPSSSAWRRSAWRSKWP